MIKKEKSFQSSETEEQKDDGCRSFKTLKDWQVDQYRMAVDENMWYMGERLGRQVDWEEAELDFLHNGYYGCAPRWRMQYCKQQCTHFSSCDLGHLFTKAQNK